MLFLDKPEERKALWESFLEYIKENSFSYILRENVQVNETCQIDIDELMNRLSLREALIGNNHGIAMPPFAFITLDGKNGLLSDYIGSEDVRDNEEAMLFEITTIIISAFLKFPLMKSLKVNLDIKGLELPEDFLIKYKENCFEVMKQ